MAIKEEIRLGEDSLSTDVNIAECIGAYLYNMVCKCPPEDVSYEGIGQIVLNNSSDDALYPFPKSPNEIVYLRPERVEELIKVAEVCQLIRTE